MDDRYNKNGNGFLMFLAGLAIGGAAVYFSDKENRKQAIKKYNSAKDAIKDKASDIQDTIEDKKEDLKENINKGLDKTQEFIGDRIQESDNPKLKDSMRRMNRTISDKRPAIRSRNV